MFGFLQSKKTLITVALAVQLPLAFAFSGATFASNGKSAVQSDDRSVTICHRDSNVKQPYGPKPITVDYDAAGNLHDNGNGDHTDHTGPVFVAGMTKDDTWGDIIPPYTWQDKSFPGMNWTTDGQAIWNNGCQIPPQTTTPPSTGGHGGGEVLGASTTTPGQILGASTVATLADTGVPVWLSAVAGLSLLSGIAALHYANRKQ